MKYLIAFSIAFVLSLSGMAQTGLVFSQCLTFGANGAWIQYAPPSDAYRTTQIIVPDGKVWKIEYAGFSGYGASGNVFLEINNIKVQQLNANSIFPIWAKTGDVINLWGTNLSGTSTLNYFFSVLEFNVN